MNKVILLVSGKAQSGKDTFASYLPDYRKYAFADKLKEYAYKLGWDGIKDDKGRKFLQDLGTACREYNPDIWVKMLCNILSNESKYPHRIIITDCRYYNEIDLMQKWGLHNGYKSTTIRIERPAFSNDLSEETRYHSSETALDNYAFDHVFYDSSKAELKQGAEDIAQKMEEREERT